MNNPYTRACPDCGQTRPIARFPKQGAGRGRTCTECTRAKRRKKTKRRRSRDRDARLRRTYGITSADYERMRREQGGVCAICARPPYPTGSPLVVDHDHTSGLVRQLLCGPCNSALGLMGDKPDRLQVAATYLVRHADKRVTDS